MSIRSCLGLTLGLFIACSAFAQSVSLRSADLVTRFGQLQGDHGGFKVPIQTSSVLYNTQILFLYAYLGLEAERAERIAELFRYVWSQQNDDGSFSAYPGDGGSADVSLMVSLAAKLHGVGGESLARLEAAIKKSKKLQAAGNLATPYLMLAGVDERVNCLLPYGLTTAFKQDQRLPWLRVLMYPLLYLFDTKGFLPVAGMEKRKSVCRPNQLRRNASFRKEGEALAAWYENHVDDIGMIFSYVPTTIPWLMALHQLKTKTPDIYQRLGGDRAIVLGLSSLEAFQVKRPSGLYQSPGEGSVAETVEVAKLMLDAGVRATHPLVQNAVDYLRGIQQASGGLGFSQHNRGFPDPDDTSLVLSIWQRVYQEAPDAELADAIARARAFVLSRANRDGGFGDWTRAQDVAWWFRPLEKRLRKTGLVVSESAVDVTARVVLGLTAFKQDTAVEEKWLGAIRWLLKHQRDDGSFLSTWMVGYGFGTASALGALATALDHPKVDQRKLIAAIDRGVAFLQTLQKSDGAWSEDLRTYLRPTALVAEKSSPAMTGIVFSRVLMFLELAPAYRAPLAATARKAYDYLRANEGVVDDSWTAVSFPKIEYARYEIIQEVEGLRSLVLFEKLYSGSRLIR